jgi:hypothetical protein
MNVDETGKDGLVAKIDEDGIFGDGGLFTDRNDLVPLDDDYDVTADLGVPSIDQTSGFKRVCLIRRSDNGKRKETPYGQ